MDAHGIGQSSFQATSSIYSHTCSVIRMSSSTFLGNRILSRKTDETWGKNSFFWQRTSITYPCGGSLCCRQKFSTGFSSTLRQMLIVIAGFGRVLSMRGVMDTSIIEDPTVSISMAHLLTEFPMSILLVLYQKSLWSITNVE